MKFMFVGGVESSAFAYELEQLGHTVDSVDETNWYLAFLNDQTPRQWADNVTRRILETQPDVLLLHKGGLWNSKGFWKVDSSVLWWARRRGIRMIYVSFDDPAFTPVALSEKIVEPFEFWLTSCPGIEQAFSPWRLPVKVREFWLAWDRRVETPVDLVPDFEVDFAVTGTPYYRSFPLPHYQVGFGAPRAQHVRAALAAGASVGLWGPQQWLDSEHGGDPAFAPLHRGIIPMDRVFLVHRAARVTLGTHLVEGWRYESGRLPRTLGAGGCLLHERRPGLAEEFGDMVEWFAPGDVSDFTEKLKGLLADPARRADMSARGQAYVLQHHTWKNRAARLLEILAE